MEKSSRREFVKSAGVLTAAALAGGAAIARVNKADASGTSAGSIVWDEETDVLVCGCGTGGSAAAVAAHDAGAHVLVIEQKSWKGGDLRRCGGGVAAANTQVQRALGIEDDPQAFLDYWKAVAGDCGDEQIVSEFVLNSSSIIDWIIDDLGGQPVEEWSICGENNGTEYDSGPGLNVGIGGTYEEYGFEPIPRCHWFKANEEDPIISDGEYMLYPTHGGTGLWKVFDNAMNEREIEVLTDTSLVRLLTSPTNGEVIGAIAKQGDTEIAIRATKGVVVATGNFVGDKDLFYTYTGKEWAPGIGGGLGCDLADDCDGTGFNAVLALGAQPKNTFVVGTNGNNPNGVSFLCGGLQFDTKARPLDVFGNPIARLYIAGVIGAGMYGPVYPVCGASVGRALYYGRIAGTQAAALEPIA